MHFRMRLLSGEEERLLLECVRTSWVWGADAERWTRILGDGERFSTWVEGERAFVVSRPAESNEPNARVEFGETSDLGKTWKWHALPGAIRGWSIGDSWIHRSRSKPNVIILGIQWTSLRSYVSLFQSTNEGRTWVSTHVDRLSDLRQIVESPDGTLWAALSKRVLRSADHGKSWKSWSGPDQIRPSCVAVGRRDPNLVLVGSPNGEVLRSDDRGATWRRMDSGLGPADIRSILIDDSGKEPKVLLGTRGAGLYEFIR